MTALETGKKIVEKLTGWRRPSVPRLAGLMRARRANCFRFRDDGLIPNHPRWPLVVYRSPVRLPDELDPAAVLEELFASHGWGDSWRNGVYPYAHYHSRMHEVLGVARGSAKLRFGGERGRTLALKAGDIAILPAGTGHQRIEADEDFLAVGAYPPFGEYDECRSRDDRDAAMKTIPKVAKPRKDPVYGANGPLMKAWPAFR